MHLQGYKKIFWVKQSTIEINNGKQICKFMLQIIEHNNEWYCYLPKPA
jgi:hypothetical protein